ncbi:hypothetical protein DHEL01_v204368 [Diaporthe helianthi]|uniref:Uncharacterized protein n=1 Tax=Diaporthe helianthi TaxID=158607 RepID=A0A2P5I423_DIAHE|nr:hypothetical protein DHEL01_v204368 [Diaporthe helianthi]
MLIPPFQIGGPPAAADRAIPALGLPRRRRTEGVRLDVMDEALGLCGSADKGEEPQDGVGKVDPDSVLHALHTTVALSVLVDIHLAKDSKESDPQDEQDQIPRPNKPESQDEGHQIQQGGDGGQGAYHLGVDPFAVGFYACLVGPAQVDSIKRADGDSECELNDVDCGEDECLFTEYRLVLYAEKMEDTAIL